MHPLNQKKELCMKNTSKLYGTHSRGLYRPLRALTLAALVLCIFAACEDGNTPKPAAATGSISGYAYFKNSSTHANITVTLEQTDGLRSVAAIQAAKSIASGGISEGEARSISASRSAAAYTKTGADGSYVFSDVAPGVYTVYASSPDSLEKAVAVNNVYLEAGKSVTALDLSLTSVGSIAGKVTLDGKTSGNFGFLVSVAGTSYMAVTGDDGGFVISGVPAGNNYLILIIKGYYTAVWTAVPQSVSGGQTTTLTAKTIASAELGTIGIVWKGESNTPPANPQTNWAYYNTADKTSYIWNGAKWDVLAAQGQAGENGLTPYIGANGNWWIGTTDTGVKAQGQSGANGQTPYIGANGNWWIGTTDTGVKAQGCDCENGDENRPPEIPGMVYVPGGSFQMGDVKNESLEVEPQLIEKPVHTVTLTGFYMGKYQVTQEQYQAVMGTNPSYFKSNPASGEVQGKRPVDMVSWYEAIEFCNALSEKEGLNLYYNIDKTKKDPNNFSLYDSYKWTVTQNASANGYRLPTEAQWEYAAKGGNGTPGNYTYSGSDTIGDVAWYGGNSGNKTHEVGKKAPNSLGIYDMSGNVWEWCWDSRTGNYPSEAQTDPTGAVASDARVLRGGAFNYDAYYLRSACRGNQRADLWYNTIGFRVARPSDTVAQR